MHISLISSNSNTKRLDLMDTVGQENDPNGPFYFPPSSSSSTNLIDVSPHLILLYTCDEATQTQNVSIMDRISGLVRGSIQFGFSSFPNMIKIDSHSNILVRTCDEPVAASLIKYFDSDGNLLCQLDSPNRFARFNRIDLNRDHDDELVCFCKEERNILFF